MEPTADEIDAAARALFEAWWPDSWDADGPAQIRESWRGQAAAALAAALPLVEARLREQIAAEIAAAEVAGLEPGPGGLGPAARWGLGLAARIARGD
jgi:hypothetical protein